MNRAAPLFAVLALVVCAPFVVAEDDDADVPKLSSRYRKVAQLEVKVPEISGMTPLPSADPSRRVFLAVSDDGRRKVDEPIVEGSLFRVTFQVGEGDAVDVKEIVPVALHLGSHIERLDPMWAKVGGWPPDLESCVPLPGTEDLYVVGAERGAEDAYDGGANRLHVVKYPAGAPDRAELQDYIFIQDLDDDTINDRFEAVVALPANDATTWRVFAFKERTAAEGRMPGYFPLIMAKTEEGYGISAPTLRGRRRLPTLLPDRERLASQADACVARDGQVWVLDRWRREIHVVRAHATAFEHVETLDYFDLVKDVPGESGTTEPAAPGGIHAGFGRHEAMCFDAHGWLWLAADLGSSSPSVVTALVPKLATKSHEGDG